MIRYIYMNIRIQNPDPPPPAEFAIKILENVRGADHCAQSAAIADGVTMLNSDESTASESFKKMKIIMRKLWLNFMTTGKPSSSLASWPAAAVGVGRAPHMSLDETLHLRGALLERRTLFWDDISYEQHYRSPPPPLHPRRPHSRAVKIVENNNFLKYLIHK